jgi:hypothetical protein
MARRDRLAHNALRFLDRFRRHPPTRLATNLCARFPHPDAVADGSLLITQTGRLRKWASFRCPGGCGKIVRLRLASSESPHWRVVIDWLGRATIAPSVRQLTSCGCHFWVRRGRIEWCADTPLHHRPPTAADASSTLRNPRSST